MKVLITGGAGFIGSHTADCALRAGLEVVVVDNFSAGQEEDIPKGCKVYKADVSGKELRDIFEGEKPDYCIHLAEKNELDESIINRGLSPNLRGLIYLLDLCKEFQIQKLVYASSAEVYGLTESRPADENASCVPVSCMGMSKLAPEEYIRLYGALYGLNYTILRYTNVYGYRQKRFGAGGVISAFLETYVNGERPIIYGKGLQSRDFVCVTDVAEANIQALTRGNGEIYNIGTGVATPIAELFDLMNEMLGQKLKPAYAPARAAEQTHVCVSYAKAAKDLGWTPSVSLREGLTQIAGDFIYKRFMDKLNGVKEAAPEPASVSLIVRRMGVKKAGRRLKTVNS
ncbi:NAD-dependent epimerase/dehydratase family protein [Paenibacillus doosanensis]|uniref:NAD-dependent epimerase/dehydratase family protein n=1 Tax=Paenibacillus doosanensis TaxID=1229154 RepID=UPI00217FE8FA|nr:NAD-dependent epimerase/dehydratase family protein [Paenibacillus doosanensis]MCS7463730.1 NAD-dependent epimerase/dehydratase family protein [Paenibacillus doosanensis]